MLKLPKMREAAIPFAGTGTVFPQIAKAKSKTFSAYQSRYLFGSRLVYIRSLLNENIAHRTSIQ